MAERSEAGDGGAPSPELRRALGLALLALILRIVASVAGVAVAPPFDAEDSFGLDETLSLAGICFDVPVLLALLRLARETRNVALWRSTIAAMTGGWIVLGLAVAPERTGRTDWSAIAAILAAFLAVCVVSQIWGRPSWVAAPTQPGAPEAASEATSETKTESWWQRLWPLFAVVAIAKFGVRALGRWIGWDSETWVTFEMGVLGVAAAVAWVWWAVVRIRLRAELGRLAAWSGWTDVGVLAAAVVALVWVTVSLALAADDEAAVSATTTMMNSWPWRVLVDGGEIVRIAVLALWIRDLRNGPALPRQQAASAG